MRWFKNSLFTRKREFLNHLIFADISLARIGSTEFVEQAMRVPARLKSLEIAMPITLFPETSVYAQAMVRATEKKSSAQMLLPFFN